MLYITNFNACDKYHADVVTCSRLGTKFPTGGLHGSPLTTSSDIVEVDELSVFIFGKAECKFRRCKKNDFRLSNNKQHDAH